MRAEQFRAEAPGRLMKSTGDALAFVPDPLPEQVALPPSTVQLAIAAENALGRLLGTTAREFNPYLVSSPLLHREAILSSRIEGTVTTPEQLVLLEAKSREPGIKKRSDEDTQEVLNYVSAMQRGVELLKELPISLRLIKEIHRVLLSGVRGERELPGEFRRDQNWIGARGDGDARNARFVPPPVPEMMNTLYDLERYLHRPQTQDSDPLLVQLALIHYQFETIHPFRDGNGRIGRLLIPLLLVSHGRLDSPILYLSAYFERNRDTYMDLLLHVSQTGDWISWINFFLRGVEESAIEANQQALALLNLRQRYHRLFQKGRSSALLIRLVDRLFESPFITFQEAARLLQVTPQAAANNIRQLEARGVVREITGRRRNQIFLAPEVLSVTYDTQGTR